MCGISGYYSKVSSIDGIDIIKRMTDVISHRGPDGEGFYNFENIYLGHRRLAIIDIDGGKQPMISQNEEYVIVFNGEIYNYIELQELLRTRNISFNSYSDTEVLLALYKEFGRELLGFLDGAYSFVIFDKFNNLLFGARDIFGEKPLFYKVTDEYFAFGSEIKQLLQVRQNEDNFACLETIVSFLFNSDTSDKSTFFQEIYSLEPSTYFVYNLGSNILETTRYYDISFNSKPACEAPEHGIETLLSESLKRRLRSDVTVGFNASGGLDSSLVISMASQGSKKELICFHSDSNAKAFSEVKYLDMLAVSLDLDLHKLKDNANPDISDILHKVVWHHDTPLTGKSIIKQFMLYKFIRKNGIKVIIDGQGADELFMGYDSYEPYLFCFKDLFGLSTSVKRNKMTLHRVLKILLIRIDGLKKVVQIIKYSRFFRFSISLSLLQKVKFKISSLEYIRKTELFGGQLQRLLLFSDRNSMANSVEVRLPYLNREILESVSKLKRADLYKNGFTKSVLREIGESWIPIEIAFRKDKLGFSVGNTDFGINNIDANEMIAKSPLCSYFLRSKVGLHKNDTMFFRLYTLCIWEQIYNIKLKV